MQNVEPNGVLEVKFIDYVNPKKYDYGGSCCDTELFQCGDCDTYFEICLQSTYTPVPNLDKCMKFVRTKQRQDDNFNFLAAFGSEFGVNREKNPIVHHFDHSWQVPIIIRSIKLYMSHRGYSCIRVLPH